VVSGEGTKDCFWVSPDEDGSSETDGSCGFLGTGFAEEVGGMEVGELVANAVGVFLITYIAR